MLSFSVINSSSALISTVSMPIPTAAEYKTKLEEGFQEFSDYYLVLFAVMALVFVVKGIVS